MAHQMLRIHWFEQTWLTKRYAYHGASAHDAPNVTQTMVWADMAHQTLRILYGVSAHGAPNVTHTLVWAHMAHQTLCIHWFEQAWLTQRYAYNGLNTHGAPNATHTMVWAHMAHQLLRIPWFEPDNKKTMCSCSGDKKNICLLQSIQNICLLFRWQMFFCSDRYKHHFFFGSITNKNFLCWLRLLNTQLFLCYDY